MLNTIKVTNEEDYTIIPVNIFVNGIKSHEIENGISIFCEHITPEPVEGQLYNNCSHCGEYVEMDCAC